MSAVEPIASWPRPSFEPGGGDAHLFLKIHGSFHGNPEVSRSRHRTMGIPAGCELQLYAREAEPEILGLGLDRYLGDELRRTNRALFDSASRAEHCLILRGIVSDPPNLDYLRDAVGLVMALLESGGTSVFDVHALKWWSTDDWRERAFDPAGPEPHNHVSILVSAEPEAGRRWVHTRGLVKFGRPDLSVHGVPPDLEPAVLELCNRFIELQAFGAVVPDGQELTMKALPAGWRCWHRGEPENPDFNNRHIEIGPAP